MFDFFLQPANLVLFEAVARLFLVSGIGWLAVRSGLLSAVAVECLSKFVIAVGLPCLIISTLAEELRYDLLPEMGLCLIAALLLNGGGLGMALAMRRWLLPPGRQGRRPFLTLAAIQNSGYLPIPLVTAILPADRLATGLLFVFVYIFVMGFVFWTLGVRLISGRHRRQDGFRQGLRQAANPPLAATVAGLFFLIPRIQSAYTGLPLLAEAVRQVGDTTIPLVLLILGGSFATISGPRADRLLIALASLIKLLIIPAAALGAAAALDLSPTFAFILILQAAMPAAMNHIVVSQEYEGDSALISRALFLQYLFSLITVPAFLLLYNALIG